MSPNTMASRPKHRTASFYRWLCQQTSRDGPLGDFARDVAGDIAFPKHARFASDLIWFVEQWRGNDGLYDAFLAAWRRYRGTLDGRMMFRRSVRKYLVRRSLAAPTESRRTRADVSVGVRTFVLERDGFRCRRCGNGPHDARLVIDHINPVASGGTNAPDNLQTLCDPCNSGKGARQPHSHDLRPLGRP